jgi:hypothetical protein
VGVRLSANGSGGGSNGGNAKQGPNHLDPPDPRSDISLAEALDLSLHLNGRI